jgi:hypothetical protein
VQHDFSFWLHWFQGIRARIIPIPQVSVILLFSFSQAEAQGTSLAVLIPPIGIFAALVYYQHGFVRVPVVGLIALGFMIGAYFGARLVSHLSPAHLRLAFGVPMLYLGFVFVLNPNDSRTGVALPAGLAAIITTVMARIFRRRAMSKTTLPPPGSDQGYHI